MENDNNHAVDSRRLVVKNGKKYLFSNDTPIEFITGYTDDSGEEVKGYSQMGKAQFQLAVMTLNSDKPGTVKSLPKKELEQIVFA